ncbi:NTP transferase domain-containing protein [Robertmurraya massiliosenegalensis]|uniref:NTP transferase domain-containing protein n=1 Tax=Robertmurraya massiliosenegalensis TaxID=1287657 RepID=UPI0002E13139|nr:NTP transferase domain-containing protein [Robertmurraya massiliosenegalensis]
MSCDYIIVQAGGKGTRMDYLTKNKPKCLVPINNLPMLFHLFNKFPDKKFIIIGDYKFDVLREYLKAFAKVNYLLIDTEGKKGTLAGIRTALDYIPDNKNFMLIWSDLVLSEDFTLPKEGQFIGISKDFQCRWKYESNEFVEESSKEFGVAGLFTFLDKSGLDDIPEEGEFVRWLQKKKLQFRELPLNKSKEYGLISEYNKLEVQKCRPFNRLLVEDGRIMKTGINEQGRQLAQKEKDWYRFVNEIGYDKVPEIHSYEPFVMERIIGSNVYEYKELSLFEKREILKNIIDNLRLLHQKGTCETDYFSVKDAYISKTFKRLSVVRDMIPFADQKIIRVNGRDCRNIYFYQKELEAKLNKLHVESFKVLHGDCTFSNMILKEDLTPVLIDPRGYFGKTKYYGDPAYDWAKLYYSLVGNYDQFNLKNFRLEMKEGNVSLEIKSNGWEELEDLFFDLLRDDVSQEQIKIIHAVIWLSLTTYAWEDFDAICGAFYNGIYHLEEVL